MTSKRSSGVNGAGETVTSLVGIMQTPAANTFVVSQRLAFEAAKFWARRMRAYADQMEELANCRSADDVAGAQTRFLDRMRDDYAAESEAFGQLLSSATQSPSERERPRES
jgi:hypothetical protein